MDNTHSNTVAEPTNVNEDSDDTKKIESNEIDASVNADSNTTETNLETSSKENIENTETECAMECDTSEIVSTENTLAPETEAVELEEDKEAYETPQLVEEVAEEHSINIVEIQSESGNTRTSVSDEAAPILTEPEEPSIFIGDEEIIATVVEMPEAESEYIIEAECVQEQVINEIEENVECDKIPLFNELVVAVKTEEVIGNIEEAIEQTIAVSESEDKPELKSEHDDEKITKNEVDFDEPPVLKKEEPIERRRSKRKLHRKSSEDKEVIMEVEKSDVKEIKIEENIDEIKTKIEEIQIKVMKCRVQLAIIAQCSNEKG